MKVPDPVGPENDAHLIEMAKQAAIVVFAYGQPCHATLRSRGLALARLLMKEAGVTPHTLRLAKNGTPWHPLYLPEILKPPLYGNKSEGEAKTCARLFRYASTICNGI